MKHHHLILFGVTLSLSSIQATPNFAREYSVDCTTCHTMIPTLNSTGKSFLRNGFRFSKEDTTSLKRLISPDENNSLHIPLSAMLNVNYDSNKEKVKKKIKLYTGGTITQNLSFFGMTKENFNSGNNDSKKLFSEESSRAYLQLNINESKNLLRVGLFSPLNSFGNLIKATADSGLKGHHSNNNDNSNKQGGRNHKIDEFDKYGQGGGGQGQNSNQRGKQGNTNYKTPIQNSLVGEIKGAEYSYMPTDKWMMSLSYGIKSEKGNNINNDDDYQFTGGVQYSGNSDYSVSVIYDHVEKNGMVSDGMLIPIEKTFDSFGLTSTLVYRDENEQEDSYYGIENSLIYAITPKDYLRGVVMLDSQDGDNDYGLSLSYSRQYQYAIFHLTGAKTSTHDSDENLFLASLSLLF